MKTRTFLDKSKWPARGEWDNEPDKAQWQDEATGLVCMALRAQSHWCGYVGVPEGHPAFKVNGDEVRIKDADGESQWPDVHGGLTFAGFCHEGEGDARICHVPEVGQPDLVWWLGFDCAHSGDMRPATTAISHAINLKYPHAEGYEHYRDLDYVRSECRKLAAQLHRIQSTV